MFSVPSPLSYPTRFDNTAVADKLSYHHYKSVSLPQMNDNHEYEIGTIESPSFSRLFQSLLGQNDAITISANIPTDTFKHHHRTTLRRLDQNRLDHPTNERNQSGHIEIISRDREVPQLSRFNEDYYERSRSVLDPTTHSFLDNEIRLKINGGNDELEALSHMVDPLYHAFSFLWQAGSFRGSTAVTHKLGEGTKRFLVNSADAPPHFRQAMNHVGSIIQNVVHRL